MSYTQDIQQARDLIRSYGGTWDGIDAEAVARKRREIVEAMKRAEAEQADTRRRA